MVDSKSLGLIINAGIGIAIFVTVLIIFDILRYFFPGLYYYREAASRDPQWNRADGRPLYALPRPSHRPFAWMRPTFAYTEQQAADTHGLDVAMYLRFLSTQAQLFAVLTLFTAIVLYPTYITAANGSLPEGDPLRPIGIEVASLANVRDKSPRLWVTLLSEIFVVAAVLFFLYRDIRVFAARRRAYRADPHNPCNYAITVLDIPLDARAVPPIYRYFDALFPGDVADVHPVRDAEKLLALKMKYVKAVGRKERAQLDVDEKDGLFDNENNNAAEKGEKTGRQKAASLAPGGHEDNAFEEVEEVAACAQEAEAARQQVLVAEDDIDAIAPMTSAALVVFSSRRSATYAATAPVHSDPSAWKVSRAAEPSGVNWNRLDIASWTIRIRHYITFAALTALALFWTVPAGLIQALGNFRKLAERFNNSFLNDLIVSSPDFVKFLEGVLPPLLLFVVLLLIPLVMRFVVSFERIHNKNVVENKIRNYLFLFYVMSNFIYVVVIGSVFNKFKAILDNPRTIVSLLSTSVPGQATFLMKYVLINSFLGSTLGLLNIGRLLIRPFMLRNARTKREIRNGDKIFANYPFTKMYALCAMVSLISVVYSTIAPIICGVATLYYCIAYVCTKHLLLYSHRPLFEGGGYLYRDAWVSILIGLYVHQVSMIGILSLKRATPQAILASLSFIFSIWFTLYCRKHFFIRLKHGSLVDQVNADEEQGLHDKMPHHFSDQYIHPGLLPVEELAKLRDNPESETNSCAHEGMGI